MKHDYADSKPPKPKPKPKPKKKPARATKAKPKKPVVKAARKPAKKTTQKFPIKLFVGVIILLIGFVYLLWNLQSGNPNAAQPDVEQVNLPETKPVNVPAKPDVKPKPVAVKQEDPLPTKPEEVWTYREVFKNKQVQVDIPKETKPSRPYQMQCGSFRTQAQADRLKASIKAVSAVSLSPHIRKVKGTKGDWYKVILGPYERKRQAEKDRHALQKNRVNGCMIWFWEGD